MCIYNSCCTCILEGKTAKSVSNAFFNKEASKAYQDLTNADKEELTTQIDGGAVMTSAEIKKRVRRITRNIQSEVLSKFFMLYFVNN